MTEQNKSEPINPNSKTNNMDHQPSDPIVEYASGKTLFQNTPNAVTYIAAGNGDFVTQSDLGGAEYDKSLRSYVEPLLNPDTTASKNNLIGLRIHNPDGTNLNVNMHQYTGTEAIATEKLRNALYEVYKREAETEYGTSVFTQNALYFKQISWMSPEEANNLLNETQQSLVKGELSGNVYDKTPENQNDVLYRQHNEMQEAVEKSAAQQLNKNTFEPDAKQSITLQDLLNTHVPSDKHQEILAMLSDKLNGTQQKDIGNHDELTS